MWKSYIKKYVLKIIFPQFCFSCSKEGRYLCDDCKACLNISSYIYCLCEKPVKLLKSGKCSRCRAKKLDGLYSALSYQNKLAQKLIHNFKYEPFIKDLSKSLSSLMIEHLQLLDNKADFSSFALIPMPLHKKRLKWRGFNQAEEIAKYLSRYLNAPLASNCLIKIKETLPQIELSGKEREENIENAFFVKDKEIIQNKKILLVDDVYTTGSTMEECARILKEGGAKEVMGITVARG